MVSKRSPYLRKNSTIEDNATGLFYVEFTMRTENGNKRTIELPRSELSDLRSLERKLLDLGAILPTDPGRRRAFLSSAAKEKCRRHLKRAACCGWANRHTFVLRTNVIGKNTERWLGIRSPENERGSINSAGTSLSWKTNVAQLATSSSHFMLAIATAFAAPLLSLCKQPSFSLCLSGNTRTGKSVAALMAGSVIGVGDISRMLTWHATDSGLEEQLPKFNDCVCLVDDFESIKGTDVQKYQRIRDFAYSISTGAERRRHSSFSSPVKQWRTILITSMEKPICELARAAKESRKGGESIRLIDIPILSKNRRHIFDRAEAEGAVVTPVWKRQMFQKATEACREHHGSVFENYVKKLCSKPADARKLTTKFQTRFIKAVELREDGDMAREVAQKFGVIYAGGKLAIRYNLVPWTHAQLLSAISECYRAARDLLPDEGVAARTGYAKLDQFLALLDRKKDISSYHSAKGYKVIKNNECRCVVKTEAFNSLFESIAQRELVLTSLMNENRIALKRPSHKATSRSPKPQLRWPDGQRRRSYRITLRKESYVN